MLVVRVIFGLFAALAVFFGAKLVIGGGFAIIAGIILLLVGAGISYIAFQLLRGTPEEVSDRLTARLRAAKGQPPETPASNVTPSTPRLVDPVPDPAFNRAGRRAAERAAERAKRNSSGT